MSPNDFGKKILAENCRKIKISEMLREVKRKLKRQLLKYEIEAEGIVVELAESKTGFGGKRFWFTCPLCKRRIGVLYKYPVSQGLGCRRCLKLDYRKHRFKGMIEAR
jgi:hypothetical protein